MSRNPFANHPFLLGFDEVERLVERAAKSASDGYPPYNIEQHGDGTYRISLAVAGFAEADLAVTLEDGQLIIIGFNPLSAFGLRHLLSGWRKKSPWYGRFYSRWRLKDWLSVLDYRVLHSEASFIRPPINSERLLRRLRGLERLQPWVGGLGGIYILRARKQTIPMTLSRRHWRRQRSSMSVGTVTSTAEHARNTRRHLKDKNSDNT